MKVPFWHLETTNPLELRGRQIVNRLNFRKLLLDLLFLVSGCAILAFGITAILRPNGLITGGTAGLAIILAELTGINYTIIFYAQALIILIGAFVLLGKAEGAKIMLLSVTFPAIVILFELLQLEFIEHDLFLASIYYGLFAGVGVGLILKRGYSLGGTDTIARILRRRALPFMSLSQILLIMDVLVIVSSLLIFDKRIALYGIITLYIIMRSVDAILFGFGSKKVKIEAISAKAGEISDFILHTIKRGTSIYDIRGGYTNSPKTKVVSVCSPREAVLIKRFIARTDTTAFVYVIPVASAWGTGSGFFRLEDEED
jgi:uncharacterized membrane-anchored protein YitT (DUF2179 family)